ncbi:hypothetical protein [Antrihabitans spumae]|uniref:Uncharacterized protein n=1 Tax=Antrihabitans spumae TaxID=3373370 RepID=A0ABW7JKJ1_9NOCA
MRTTAGTSVSPSALAASADEYTKRGWMVTTTANGISLITDANVCGIEIPAEYTDGVHAFMQANMLLGPVIELPGSETRQIHLVTGVAKAALAIAALRELGAIVYMDGDTIALPPTQMIAGSARWAVSPEESRWVPPLVAVAAAVRSVKSSRWARRNARVAC